MIFRVANFNVQIKDEKKIFNFEGEVELQNKIHLDLAGSLRECSRL